MTNNKLNTFSKRELEILQLLAEGNTSKEIGTRLKISELTVQTHRRNMLRKLKLSNSRQLVVWGIQVGHIKL